jgi:hypothetical protein
VKILTVTPNYPPSSRVGAWLATHEFMRHMADAGDEVQVVAYGKRCAAWELDGIPVTTGLRGRSWVAEQARGADVVVSHAGDAGYGLEVAERAGRPAVRMVHGHGAEPGAGTALAVYNSESSRAASSFAGASIVVHPPVWPSSWELDRSSASAVTLVNLTADKGAMVAWRLAELEEHRSFIGVRGGYGEQIVPRARNFEVVATTRNMAPIYARTRVLLMPSARETWGMVGVEAMSAGIPVVAHPTAGLLESLAGAGIFADRDDLGAWQAALERLDDPVEYELASARARARALELHPGAALERFRSAMLELVAVSS